MRIFKYFLTYSLFLTALYLGFIEEIDGAKNVVMVFVWFTFFVSLLCFTDVLQKALKEKGRAIPAWVDNSIDVGIGFFLVWFGLFWTGTAWILHIIISEGAWQLAIKEEDNNE